MDEKNDRLTKRVSMAISRLFSKTVKSADEIAAEREKKGEETVETQAPTAPKPEDIEAETQSESDAVDPIQSNTNTEIVSISTSENKEEIVSSEPNGEEDSEYIIELRHVTKVFDGIKVIDDENFSVKKGEFITLLGPSGCGKSTTLRMIAGFETPTSGEIILDGRDIVPVPPYRRPVNTVFQHYALFPNLDVYGNVAFGLRLKKVPIPLKDKEGNPILKVNKSQINYYRKQIARFQKDSVIDPEIKRAKIEEFQAHIERLKNHPEQAYKYRHLTDEEIDDRVMRALQIVDLDDMEDRSISTLSGGQQQRVAIARAICLQPKILLLDEPLGALDLKMRKDMQLELKEMHRKLGITFIYVTHDQEEALTMSDRVLVMSNGIIQQIGTPTEIYNEPRNAFVADFIGDSNIYNGVYLGNMKVHFLSRTFDCVDTFPAGERVDVVVRPEDVKLSREPGFGTFPGRIDSRVFKGIFFQYSIMVGREEVIVKSTEAFDEGSEVNLLIEPDEIHIMKKELSLNIFTDATIDKNNHLCIGDTTFDVDVTKLLANSKLDSDGYLIQGGKKYDLTGLKVTATVRPEDIEITDDTSGAQITGTVDSSVWKGDHYVLVVRGTDDQDYIVATPYSFNVEDSVGLSIAANRFALKAKGELSDYEL